MDDFRVKLAGVTAEVMLLLLSDDEMRFFSSGEVEEVVAPLLGEERVARTRILGYVERVVWSYDDYTFRRHFRMTKLTFNIVLQVIQRYMGREDDSRPGRPSVSTDKQLLLTLWYLANQETIRSIGDRFGVCDATVHRTVRRMMTVVKEAIMGEVVVWPTGDRAKAAIEGFRARCGVKNVIGAIDGSHIAIKAPSQHQTDYINRKGFHSIVLQAVCDNRMLFTDCFVGWPGSVHDSRVYRNSPLFQAAESRYSNIFPMDSFLVGDAAYPLSKWTLTPFRDTGNLSEKVKYYNFAQSSTRIVIEQAFAALKGRFRRLKYIDMDSTSVISDVVLTACTFHNVCILGEDNLEDFIEDIEDGRQIHDADNYARVQIDTEGKRKRQTIADELWANM
ncbi:putative nuclease HARBI1 [Corticium candelabrum]|uniref:putative nuclease HARBI1 n=2 Tax=Corticium candelabrum TaxID=121492 RepID=UPI002E274A62|nr:putative nuclease HARBI1 [Corticium candelabrum]